MNKLLLFCVETTKQANTDYPYIQATIKQFYGENRKIVRRPVFMRSKTRYNNHAVTNEIERYKKSFPNGNVSVIYCIDVDDYDISPATQKLLEDIKQYCRSNHYDFVFFCRDVEDVFWGRTVHKNEKTRMAAAFNEKQQIKSVKEDRLRKTRYAKSNSNILNILDQYMERKQSN